MLLEIVGWKWVTGLGVLLSSVSIALVGVPFSILELYFLRFAVATGVLPVLMSPLVADYVQIEYWGRAYGYVSWLTKDIFSINHRNHTDKFVDSTRSRQYLVSMGNGNYIYMHRTESFHHDWRSQTTKMRMNNDCTQKPIQNSLCLDKIRLKIPLNLSLLLYRKNRFDFRISVLFWMGVFILRCEGLVISIEWC